MLLRRDFLSWKRVTSGLQRLRNLRLRATLLTACYAILQCGTGIEHFKLRARFLEIVRFRCHKPRPEMTKTELQIAVAAATQTNKRTAGVFLDTLSTLAYKAIKKNGEIRPAWLWQASKAEEEGSYGRQSKDAREDQDSSQDCRQIPSRQGCKGRHSRGEEVV